MPTTNTNTERAALRAVADAGGNILHWKLVKHLVDECAVDVPTAWGVIDALEDAGHIGGEYLPFPEGYQWHFGPSGRARLRELQGE